VRLREKRSAAHAACRAIHEIDQGRRPTLQPTRSKRIDVMVNHAGLMLQASLERLRIDESDG